MTLFERVFGGNDAVYGLTEAAVDAAIAANGEEKAVSFPDTAYALPCYYAVTGVKVTNLKEMKEALGVVKSLMTRENQLNDVFMSGVATALCAEFIEVLKYIDGATPYEEPCYGHLGDAVIRELGGDAIFHVHAKDTRLDKYNMAKNGALDTKSYADEAHRSWIFRSVGYGNDLLYWKDIISALRLVGYDYAISIEHEDSLMSQNEGLMKAVETLKSAIIFEPKMTETRWI